MIPKIEDNVSLVFIDNTPKLIKDNPASISILF